MLYISVCFRDRPLYLAVGIVPLACVVDTFLELIKLNN